MRLVHDYVYVEDIYQYVWPCETVLLIKIITLCLSRQHLPHIKCTSSSTHEIIHHHIFFHPCFLSPSRKAASTSSMLAGRAL